MGKKQYRFWTYGQDLELQKYLDSIPKFSDFLRELLTKCMNGKITDLTDEDLKKEKLRVDIKSKELDIKLKEKQLLYYDIFHKTPSSGAQRVMKINIENQLAETPSCFDEINHRIMCPECGSCFVFSVDLNDVPEAKELFIDHYIQKHGMKFPEQLQLELKSF